MSRLFPAWTATVVVTASLAASCAAHADESFGKKVSVAVSAERLFGLNVMNNTFEDAGQDRTNSYTQFSLFATPNTSPYDIPRAAVDVFFGVDGLSVGGALGFVTRSASTERNGNENDLDDYSAVLIAPRVGYAHMFTDLVGLWGRGGLTYYNLTIATDGDADTSASANGVSLNLEPNLVLSPVNHVAFLVGMAFDIPVSGTADLDLGNVTFERDDTWFNFGLTAGVAVYF